jgi:aryl-alcohol dehydrogenase-like predicted oxidoreductase
MEENLRVADCIREFAESRGHSLLELAFSWLASRPSVASVIAGASSPEQAQANARAARWMLTEGDLTEVDDILARHASKLLQ